MRGLRAVIIACLVIPSSAFLESRVALGQNFSGPANITQPTTPGDCVEIASGGGNNLVDSGEGCSVSGGSITPGLSGSIAYYAANGSVISDGVNATVGVNALTIGGVASIFIPQNDPQDFAIGNQALGNLTTTSSGENTAYGYRAGLGATSVQGVTLIGKDAGWGGGVTGWTGGFSTIVGAAAGAWLTGAATANTDLGDDAGEFGTTYTNSTFLGYRAGRSDQTIPYIGTNNVGIGLSALGAIEGNVCCNTAVGTTALAVSTSGANNTAVGYNALTALVSASSDTAVGFTAGAATTGNQNSFFGTAAGNDVTSAAADSGFGYDALGAIGGASTGSFNSAFGYGSLQNIKGAGADNSGFGVTALGNITTGSNNAALGYGAGQFIANGSTANTTSGQSVYLGFQAYGNANNDVNEIVIGYTAVGNGSNTITLGNTSIIGTYLNGAVSGAKSFGLSGNQTAGSIFGTSGILYKNGTPTLSDTASSGTIAVNYDSVFGGETLTATSATTLTANYGSYFKVPVCSTNVSCTANVALGADSISSTSTLTSVSTISTLTGNFRAQSNTAVISLGSSSDVAWSRDSAGVFDLGTGAQGSKAGSLNLTNVALLGTLTVPGTTTAAITSSATFTSGAASGVGTLTNAPTGGNPTTWIKINDNGTTRYIPAW